MLDSMFAGSVRADRVDRMALITRQVFWLAINSPAGGYINDMLNAILSGIFQQVDRAAHVHLGIEERVSNRAAHIHLRGMMVDKIWSLC